jgi:hypothetical protein
LRNYLYDSAARWQQSENLSKPVLGLPRIVSQLCQLCHHHQSATPQVQADLDAYVQGKPGYFKPPTGDSKPKARKSTATKRTKASGGIAYHRRPTLTQLRQSELGDSACEDVDVTDAASVASATTQGSVQSPLGSEVPDLDETRSMTSVPDDGSSLALSDTLSNSSKASTPLPSIDGGLTAEALSKHNEMASNSDGSVVEPSQTAASEDHTATKTPSKKLALKLLIVQEFVKELAAFGMEHALFAIAI